jgi:hypothetical protein
VIFDPIRNRGCVALVCGKRGAAYSTVTLFARLRGWSASFPMTTAV